MYISIVVKMVRNGTDCLLLNAALAIAKIQQPNLEPVHINVSVTIQDFRILNLNNMMFQMVFFVTQQWIDKRLGTNNIQEYKRSTGGKMWQPNVMPTNLGDNCCDNENMLFWRVYGDEGHVLLSKSMIITNYCTTNYRKFPFDHQSCPVTFSSYRFLAEEVSLKWHNKKYLPTDIPESDFKEFQLMNISQSTEIISRSSGNFSTVTITLDIKRNYIWYLLLTFLPTIMATVLSYFTFWIPITQYLLKYSINIITTSFLLYLIAHYNLGLDYLRTIDLFLFKNLFFNIIPLLHKLIMDIYFYYNKNSECFNTDWCVKTYLSFAEKFMKILLPFAYIMITIFFYFFVY